MDTSTFKARKSVYEKPTLHRLGLLRLMTRFSFAGGDDGGEHGQHGGDHGQHGNHKHN